jgi:hypothetical protein
VVVVVAPMMVLLPGKVTTVDRAVAQPATFLCFAMADLAHILDLLFRMQMDHVKDTMAGIPLAQVVPALEQVQVAEEPVPMDKIKIIPSTVQTVDLVD